MKHSDLAAMLDEIEYNSGFIVVKPTEVNRRIYTMMQDISHNALHLHDQDVLNLAIDSLHKKKIQTAATYLDNRLFMDGVRYSSKRGNCCQAWMTNVVRSTKQNVLYLWYTTTGSSANRPKDTVFANTSCGHMTAKTGTTAAKAATT